MSDSSGDIKQLRYRVMLALYLPILLYSFSTFDLAEDTVVMDVTPTLVEGYVQDTGEGTDLVEDKGKEVSVENPKEVNLDMNSE